MRKPVEQCELCRHPRSVECAAEVSGAAQQKIARARETKRRRPTGEVAALRRQERIVYRPPARIEPCKRFDPGRIGEQCGTIANRQQVGGAGKKTQRGGLWQLLGAQPCH